jgi:AraC family transcriptional regulator, regulatory protein of adaptative response / DNA-3-methyladenine glycosylase II
VHQDHHRWYRAVASRDSRFDGHFVTAVRTTGIYCRPSCPAQTPKRENVTFYPCAAAAVAAGFRACKRCRPEAAPGSREWDVRGDLAARALRAIAAGALDSAAGSDAASSPVGVPALASSLHVSERQLNRVLIAEVGAGPLALARTRRAQTARLLLDATDLPISTVAFTAGFASLRQFNDTMREHFAMTPSEIRRTPNKRVPGTGTMTLRLAYRAPYAVAAMTGWLRLHLVAGIEDLVGDTYRRALPNGSVVSLQITDDAILLTTSVDDLRALPETVARCRRMLDADADPAAVDTTLAQDPTLAPMVAARPGLRVPGVFDGFELLVRTVLGQHVSVASAQTFARRLVETYGKPLDVPLGGVTTCFPTADALAEASFDGIGLTGSRIETLREAAKAHAAGELPLDPTGDRDEARAALLALPGVGPWTTDYVAMRGFGDPDSFPGTDLILRRLIAERNLDPQRWRPWRSYAAMHLWMDHLTTTGALDDD